jgi:peptide/nickel transport system ATP-binding protein
MPVLEVRNLKKYFPIRRSIKEFLTAKPPRFVRAVDDISFSIEKREIFALVGESGCGKTTTAKLVMRLLEPTSGNILFNGNDITKIDEKEYRRKVQMVFQDPYASMNPRFRVYDVLEEPLLIAGVEDRKEREERIMKALEAGKSISSIGVRAQISTPTFRGTETEGGIR